MNKSKRKKCRKGRGEGIKQETVALQNCCDQMTGGIFRSIGGRVVDKKGTKWGKDKIRERGLGKRK